jgi:hypothetical protein
MNRTEELIRDTLVRQADRRPRPDAILAVLQRNHRSRDRTRAVLVAVVAAVVVAAVAIPLALQRSAPPPPEPGATTITTVPTVPPRPPTPTLTYTAGWLPDGFVERYRVMGAFDMQLRTWSTGRVIAGPGRFEQDASIISLHVHTAAEPGWEDMARVIADSTEPVTVQGHPGAFLLDQPAAVRLVWTPAPNTFLTVYLSRVADGHETALRVAESVREDGTSQVQPEIGFGELPAGLAPTSTAVLGNAPDQGMTALVAGGSPDNTSAAITVQLLPTEPAAEAGTPVTVRGLPGRYVAPIDRTDTESGGFSEAQVRVRLEDDRWLVVAAPPVRTGDDWGATPLTMEQLVSVADGLTFHGKPDYGWLGGR